MIAFSNINFDSSIGKIITRDIIINHPLDGQSIKPMIPMLIIRRATYDEYIAYYEEYFEMHLTNPPPRDIFFYEVSVD